MIVSMEPMNGSANVVNYAEMLLRSVNEARRKFADKSVSKTEVADAILMVAR